MNNCGQGLYQQHCSAGPALKQLTALALKLLPLRTVARTYLLYAREGNHREVARSTGMAKDGGGSPFIFSTEYA
jgi:hypothetical protein